MNSFFRYPGGKSKLKKVISKHLSIYASENGLEYREPFFGGGSIGIEFLSMFSNRRRKIWINDKDSGIAALWTSVIRYPDLLKTMVIEFIPSVEAFYQYRDILTSISENLSSEQEIAKYGFMKLAVHQISYSGLGTKSGGPLGGKKQGGKYKIDCRWSPEYICGKIDFLHRLLNEADVRGNQCANLDFMDLIKDQERAILYLDPPYYEKGNDLYQYGFLESDHVRMANALRETNHAWLLSYDDCQEVRDLYDWAVVERLDVNYSITANKDNDGGRSSRTKPELLIYPEKHASLLKYEQETKLFQKGLFDEELFSRED